MNNDYASSSGASDGGSILSNPYVFGGVAILVLAGCYFGYKYYTKSNATESKSGAGSEGDGKDYTNLPNSKTVYATSPDSLNGLNLGGDVKVKSGTGIVGMDKGLGEHETTTLNADTVLGKAWHLFPSSVIVRANGMAYPFYKVAISSVVK